MDYSLSEEQEIIKKAAHDFLTNECPTSFIREMIEDEKGYSPEMWKKMADLGWMGFIYPVSYGGMEGSFLDLAVLLEEMGKFILPGPYFSSVILGGQLLLEGGNEKQKDKYIPSIVNGESIFTLALIEASAKYTPGSIKVTAKKSDNGYIIDGTKLFVSDAHVAQQIIVAARTKDGVGADGITLFVVDGKSSGVSYTALPTIAGDKQFVVKFDKVLVPNDNILGDIDQGWSIIEKIWPKIIVCRCAQIVGAAQQAFDMTIQFVKERKQFGQPLGTLQAIHHFCADMAADLDGCRYMTYQAAWMLSEGLPCVKEIAMAKSWCSDAFKRITAKAHQAHGAMGFTEEYDLHLYYKNAKSWELLYGDSAFHREVVAQQMGM